MIGRSYCGQGMAFWDFGDPARAGFVDSVWQWKVTIFDREDIFKSSIFHCHVSLQEGIQHDYPIYWAVPPPSNSNQGGVGIPKCIQYDLDFLLLYKCYKFCTPRTITTTTTYHYLPLPT